ncbi:PLP-dependent cysteine synthase family protein [Oceanobacillus picturae]|uniref:PLP-dependent cysteine synthase family protein n=1 Tax=Oceanobacillus picturae TaxID=171693 RepID=UPI000E686E88|nr:cysteine synthase family protein [Oceanobacillus picturae]RIU90625.1 cysteine synthase family protein [Oceanobacillus picturae]
MAMYASVQELIGNTPLLELKQFDLPKDVKLYAKLEFMNPGGSVKDRLGVSLIQDALETGVLQPGGTIIEPTAGNTGIGLAMAAITYNLNAIFCVPEHFSKEKQTIMKALGARIVQTPQEEGMVGAIKKAEELCKEIPGSFCPQQFSNPANPATYYHTLAPEIWRELEGKVDIFVAGAGSAGTFMGSSRFFKEKNPAVHTAIVEPEGSIIAGGKAGSHRTEGIGMEFFPSYFDRSFIDKVYTVTDKDAFDMVGQLARKEGLLVGSSSGSAMFGALQEAKKARPGTTIVTIFPDGSDRYISKNIYDNV